jgi:tryptophan-rich sensory protein
VRHPLVRLVSSLGICLLAGYFGSLYVVPLLPSWFATLSKPAFVPSDSYIVLAGLLVYVLFGFALYFIWQADPMNYRDKKLCLFFFIFGLVLHVLWVYSFFGLQSPFMGLMISIMLLAILFALIFQTLRVSVGASLFLTPCLIISFIAAYANYLIFVMNPQIPLFLIR